MFFPGDTDIRKLILMDMRICYVHSEAEMNGTFHILNEQMCSKQRWIGGAFDSSYWLSSGQGDDKKSQYLLSSGHGWLVRYEACGTNTTHFH